jgi:hypothetical protein
MPRAGIGAGGNLCKSICAQVPIVDKWAWEVGRATFRRVLWVWGGSAGDYVSLALGACHHEFPRKQDLTAESGRAMEHPAREDIRKKKEAGGDFASA